MDWLICLQRVAVGGNPRFFQCIEHVLESLIIGGASEGGA